MKISIGERIKNLRKSKNWTLAVLAKKTNLSKGFLCDLETGRRNMGLKAILSLSYVFNCSTDFLIKGTK